jgi:hypothetical protein
MKHALGQSFDHLTGEASDLFEKSCLGKKDQPASN